MVVDWVNCFRRVAGPTDTASLMAALVGNDSTLVPDPVVPAAANAIVTLVETSTVRFNRSDGYSWSLTQTAAQQGTLQLRILDGIPLGLGMQTESVSVSADGQVTGLLQEDGAYFARQ